MQHAARLAIAVFFGGMIAAPMTANAAWSASGTVKNNKGVALSGAVVSIKDSARLTTTTSNTGAFSLNFTIGVTRKAIVRDYSAQLFGNDLVVTFPGNGELDLRLVDLSGTTLWSGTASLNDGEARAALPNTNRRGPAILRMSLGDTRVSQPVTLLGTQGAMLVPRFSARTLATYPTILAKMAGHADTTFVMTSMNQSNINIVLRDTTTPKSTTCKLPPSPNPGSGGFTKYWFGQGTGKDGEYYKTACGYRGTETAGENSDKMFNIPNEQYFVAIPSNSSSDFNKKDMCGACVELTGANGKKIIATVTDECPNDVNAPCKGNPDGHLDVSAPAFGQLGFSTGDPRGVTWKFATCPAKGNIIVRLKDKNTDMVYIENTILPIKSVKVGSNEADHLNYGAWQLSRNGKGAKVTVTDYSDRTVTFTIPTTATSETDINTGVQFPACDN